MPRFYFDIAGDHTLVDEEGTVHSDANGAKEEATCTIAQIAKDDMRHHIRYELFATVRDENGVNIFRAHLLFNGEWLTRNDRV